MREKGPGTSDRAVISVERATARAAPSGKGPVVATLTRGTAIKVLESKDDYWKIVPPQGGEVWIEGMSFERLPEKAAREKRASAVGGFTAEKGRALESCPILLAPVYGAASWGELEDGDDVDVLLADHDFYGVRLPDRSLGFVPARSIRLLASSQKGVVPPVVARRNESPNPIRKIPEESGSPGGEGSRENSEEREEGSNEPLSSLPASAEPPQLLSRVEPRYPEVARRGGLGGDVVLRVVVEATGRVGRVEVVTGAPFGLTNSATDAVAKWIYRPARIDGRPVAVWKVVRVRFSVSG